jgi:hypothetical protein
MMSSAMVGQPQVHVPQSKFMRQVELDSIVGRLRQFSLKDELASTIAVNRAALMVDKLEDEYAELSAQQAPATHVDEQVTEVTHEPLDDQPTNIVDPINVNKRTRRNITQSNSRSSQEAQARMIP